MGKAAKPHAHVGGRIANPGSLASAATMEYVLMQIDAPSSTVVLLPQLRSGDRPEDDLVDSVGAKRNAPLFAETAPDRGPGG